MDMQQGGPRAVLPAVLLALLGGAAGAAACYAYLSRDMSKKVTRVEVMLAELEERLQAEAQAEAAPHARRPRAVTSMSLQPSAAKQTVEQLSNAIIASLPERIILVRHGESEGNADHTLYRTKPDNKIVLTDKGAKQAAACGLRIKKLIGSDRVSLIASPFVRTLQTMGHIRKAFDRSQVVRTSLETRVREQEFGNLQGVEFNALREEQKLVGRFWYRFPTGESGADVYGRVKQWWESLLSPLTDLHVTREEPVNNIVVVTHGLTMRLILMQLHGWSPRTFHSVWNAGNCDIYVLKKNRNHKGRSPFVLCEAEGDMPNSSKEMMVYLKDGSSKAVVLEHYLSIPPLRTQHLAEIKEQLALHHGLAADEILRVTMTGPNEDDRLEYVDHKEYWIKGR